MKPDVKVVAAAIATLIVWAIQAVTGTEVPIGIEGAIAVVVAYLVPSTAKPSIPGTDPGTP